MQRTVHLLLSFLLFPLALLAQSSRSVHVDTAGTLANQISEEEKYAIEELVVTGEINGTDFRLLRDMAGNNWQGMLTEGRLSKLDLSGVTIVAGGENYLETTDIYIMEDYTIFDPDGFAFAIEANVIPQWGFVGCNSLTAISLPQTAIAVGDYAFFSGYIATVTFGDHLQSIGQNAFYHNISLTEIALPATLTTIGNNAFNYCSGLQKIYSCASVPSAIPDKAFNVYDKATLYVPVGSLSTYQSTAAWNKFLLIEEFEPVTGIAVPSIAATRHDIYSLTGRRMSTGLPKGIYIVNHKKVMVK